MEANTISISDSVDPQILRQEAEKKLAELGAVMIFNCDPSTPRGQAWGGKEITIPPLKYRALTSAVADHLIKHDKKNREGDSYWLTTDETVWKKCVSQFNSEGKVTNPNVKLRHVTAYADRIEVKGPKDESLFNNRLWRQGVPLRDDALEVVEDERTKQVTVIIQRDKMGTLTSTETPDLRPQAQEEATSTQPEVKIAENVTEPGTLVTENVTGKAEGPRPKAEGVDTCKHWDGCNRRANKTGLCKQHRQELGIR